jgi:hypothetical protein
VSRDEWEHLHERLGLPDDPQTMERVQALVENGWEFLGVRFLDGVWIFRRPARNHDPEAMPKRRNRIGHDAH